MPADADGARPAPAEDPHLRLLGALCGRGAREPPRCLPRPAELLGLLLLAAHLAAAAAALCWRWGRDWTYARALYFCVATLTTVGYGDEVVPAGSGGRTFTILFIWSNVLVGGLVLGVLGSCVGERVSRQGHALLGRGWDVPVIVPVAALLAETLLLAWVFVALEQRSWVEGLYLSTMTLTTVGYGQLGPISQGTRWLLCPVLLVAVTAAALLTGQLAECLRAPLERRPWARSKRARLLLSSSVVLVVSFAFGAAFSCWGSQGWTLLDGFFFAAVTVTTVGYGDLAPAETELEMWLAVALMWTGAVLVSAWLQRIGSETSGLGGNLARKLPRVSGGGPPPATRGRRRGCCGRRCRWLLAELCAELAPESDAGREALGGLAFLAALHAGGAVLFSWLESWSLADSMYFTVVTLSTVGYGDLHPSHPRSRAAAAAFVLVGVPASAELVGLLSCFWAGALAELLEGVPAGSAPASHACLFGDVPEMHKVLQGAMESISVTGDDTVAPRKLDDYMRSRSSVGAAFSGDWAAGEGHA